jgi:hypothetical protein
MNSSNEAISTVSNKADKVMLALDIISGHVQSPTMEQYKLLGIENMVPIASIDLHNVSRRIIEEFITATIAANCCYISCPNMEEG